MKIALSEMKSWLRPCPLHSFQRFNIQVESPYQHVFAATESKPVFFNLFAAAEPSATICVAHGTLWNDPSAVAYLRYGRHGSCHGRHFDGSA